MAGPKTLPTACGCTRDMTTAATGREPGCCAPSDEAAPEGDGSACCGSECCAGEGDVTLEGEAKTAGRRMDIEFLYLDLSVCERCQGTESSLEGALAEVARVLELAGVAVTLRRVHVQTEQQARDLGFVSSPTLRINGRDIQMLRGNPLDVKESPCNCGGCLCGQDIDCRDWVFEGKEYETPPVALIVDAILREAFASVDGTPATSTLAVDLPDNLKKFFAAKRGIAA